MDYKNLTINENKSILEALEKLNKIRDVSRLILFVTNENEQVVGSLTDGDIRRSLAKDKDLNKKIGEICYRDFVHKKNTNGFIELESIRKQKIVMLPLLNEDKSLNRVLDLDKIKSVIPVECVIMAGGRGKRLSPLTDTIPKPMLPLGDKPIIEYNIDRLISFGINKIYISVKYLGEQIQEYFGDGSSKGIKIEYIWEDTPLGTAGSLSLVDKFDSDQILLMNSDLFTNVNIEEMYLQLINENADMVIASTEYKIDVPYAVFESSDYEVSTFKEKPTYVYHSNAGVYLFHKNLISKIPKNSYYDITDLMDRLIKENKKILHNPIRGYWIDIGKPSDYENAKEFIKHLN
ncbi:nucleotidyltransferase family protein [Polaribacter dokdonensis]|uniref:CBS domain-containing protein n=1 Tax=Polaribacter dokdonensis DSW-5 TaxID=1300348 RepID=A0A0M9CF52_9FLAO|nr:nucleotidyltransferase family protein [Polaribacter dokdonensis]KOY50665.1 Nucleotidyl transferase [Polaribacter dokdonensis DSW-5]SEE62447.1 CBS domain-containing protein [Polaribacter dokdonensis DSW-5]